MRVLAYRGPGVLELEDRPQPHARDGEVVVRVDACAICGTDLRIAAGGHRAYADASGRVPGHEISATVVEVGGEVGAAVGDRAFVAPNYGCGQCRACRRQQVNLCPDLRAIGITEDGGFAEYLRLGREPMAQGNLLLVDGQVDPGAIALAEPLACALRGSQACRLQEGDVVLVYGAGPIGLLHIALARLAGAGAVVVCEPNAQRRERALGFGASSAYGVDGQDLRHALGPDGADAVIVATPAAAAQKQALELAGPGGRVNFFAGLPRDASTVDLDTNLVHYKELVVTGTTASTNESCRAALDLITSGRLPISELIDARMDLGSAQRAFELARSGQVMKAVVQP
jgi:L-iditol 2-dehydrogenase